MCGLEGHADHETFEDGVLVDIDKNAVCADRAIGGRGCVYGVAIVAMHREACTVKYQGFIRGYKLWFESLTRTAITRIDACIVC